MSSKQAHPKHAVTPPKGRPTRTRTIDAPRGTFGSTFQWAAVAGVITVAFVVLVILTG